MLPGSMQDAIKARAAKQQAEGGFKDPYVKPKMSKENFLAERNRGEVPSAPGGGGGAPVDLSPVIMGQNQIQRQLQQLAEEMKRLSMTGGGSSSSTTFAAPTAPSSNAVTPEQLETLKREIRQGQRQATNDVVSQIESIIASSSSAARNSSSSPSSGSDAAAQVSRLERQVAQLQAELSELKQENEQLRQQQSSEISSLKQENERLRRQAAAVAASSSSSSSSSTPTSTYAVTKTNNTAATPSSQFTTNVTGKAHELTLNLPGISINDVNISYGSGALQLVCKGKTYEYKVSASDIDSSNISATLHPNGGLIIVVPKK